ncbi:MAG: hypothetical protein ACI8XO_003948 [Verrucomicrobiales bacterium]|jgi:hypothetical protein
MFERGSERLKEVKESGAGYVVTMLQRVAVGSVKFVCWFLSRWFANIGGTVGHSIEWLYLGAEGVHIASLARKALILFWHETIPTPISPAACHRQHGHRSMR